MSRLTMRERELVSLGSAVGSNCITCIEHHIPASREAGLTDAETSEAVRLADDLRQVPARRTLDAADRLLAAPNAPACAAAISGQVPPPGPADRPYCG